MKKVLVSILTLNQYDDQAIDFDNSILGIGFTQRIKGLFRWNLLAGSTQLWSGEPDLELPFDDRVPIYRHDHRVIGVDLELSTRPFKTGLSILQSREQHPFLTGREISPPGPISSRLRRRWG